MKTPGRKIPVGGRYFPGGSWYGIIGDGTSDIAALL